MTADERMKEIEDLIASYGDEIIACENDITADELGHAYNMGSIKSAYEAIIDEIKDFGDYMFQMGACREDLGEKCHKR